MIPTRVWPIAAAALLATGAQAQTMPAPASMTEHPCPAPMPGPPPGMVAALLQPGAKLPNMSPTNLADPALQDYMRKHTEGLLRDYADLCRYKPENAALTGHPDVVLMGDSITDNWIHGDPSLFSAKVVDRGIGGQTSPQMLVRFYQDVVALHPHVVHIMAGTNDVAGNTGPTSPEDYKNNIRAMVVIAKSAGIKVVIAAIPPADHFPWHADLHPETRIAELNGWLRGFAREQGAIFVDYGPVLATPAGGMKPDLSNDGVHPNIKGYALMRPLFQQAVAQADR